METTVHYKKDKKDIKFPLIARFRDTGALVYFISYTTGMKIHTTDISELNNTKDLYSCIWMDCSNTEQWEILDNVTITFSNK